MVIKKTTLRNIIIGVLTVVFLTTLAFIARPYMIEAMLSRDLRKEFARAYATGVEVASNVVELDLVASQGAIEVFEGSVTEVWNYNGTVPGPEIRIKLGEQLRVNFTNDLSQETTIHWHGVRVPNAMDGVPGVNQDPIQPGESFVYEFIPKDPGTFWFHPHVRAAEQIERGLYGTLIVEDEYSEQYSQDVTWIVDDWKLNEDYQIVPDFVTVGELMHDGRWGNVITVNGSQNEVLAVQPGERIRLRLVNVSNGRVYALSFGPLDAKIIAVDGMYTRSPVEANGFELAPGNRIDLDIRIPAEDYRDSYSIVDYFTSTPHTIAHIAVSGNPVEIPDFDYFSNPAVPHWTNAVNAEIDKSYRLNARRGGANGIEWTINERAFPDYDPVVLEYDEFNLIEFVNESARLHPMHLHGQFFKVISRNGQAVDEPFFRDTILVKSRETIVIGLVPLDQGSWAQHCHILEHAEAGMLTVVEVE